MIDYSVKGKVSGIRQRYQVTFPAPDKVVINYQSVVTGPNTIVGIVGAPGDGDQWYPLPNKQYNGTALKMDIAGVEVDPPTEASKPPVDDVKPVSEIITPGKDWTPRATWEDSLHEYKVMWREKAIAGIRGHL